MKTVLLKVKPVGEIGWQYNTSACSPTLALTVCEFLERKLVYRHPALNRTLRRLKAKQRKSEMLTVSRAAGMHINACLCHANPACLHVDTSLTAPYIICIWVFLRNQEFQELGKYRQIQPLYNPANYLTNTTEQTFHPPCLLRVGTGLLLQDFPLLNNNKIQRQVYNKHKYFTLEALYGT